MLSHALVLTAGLGTRLRPLTDVRAKPAMPVAGEPMIRRIVRWLARNGVTDLVLNLHHRPDTVAAVVGDGSDLSASVRYSWEQPVALGSAGGPRLALPLVGADRFLVVNGDTLTDVDLRALAFAHETARALVTLALVPNREPHRYGGVGLDADRRVRGFAPRGPAAERSYHFIGVQIVEAEVFRPLSAGQPARSIGGLYDALIAARPGTIRGCVSDARFWDVGTVSDYWATSRGLTHAEAAPDVTCGRRVRLDPSARVTRSILWDDVDVERGSVIDECVITDRVRVPAGTTYRRMILLCTPDGTLRTSPLPL